MLTDTNYATFNPPVISVRRNARSDQTSEKVSHYSNKFFSELAPAGCCLGWLLFIAGFPVMLTGLNGRDTQLYVGIAMTFSGFLLAVCSRAAAPHHNFPRNVSAQPQNFDFRLHNGYRYYLGRP